MKEDRLRDGHFREQALRAFRTWIAAPEFPCLGAKAAFNAESYRLETYGCMATDPSTVQLARDLRRFAQRDLETAPEYATFIAVFRGPLTNHETQFEAALWQQLKMLNDIDRQPWDPAVRSDPADPHFSFSFANQALYVIGLHPNSSRDARRFAWPTLVFNPHEQFERLRSDGKWKRMQQTIRERDLQLQGSTNPMLSDFGERSEARQYSGRAVEEDWQPPIGRCPFHR